MRAREASLVLSVTTGPLGLEIAAVHELEAEPRLDAEMAVTAVSLTLRAISSMAQSRDFASHLSEYGARWRTLVTRCGLRQALGSPWRRGAGRPCGGGRLAADGWGLRCAADPCAAQFGDLNTVTASCPGT